jgi:drug/metabolite transporter (DMT)-like permease
VVDAPARSLTLDLPAPPTRSREAIWWMVGASLLFSVMTLLARFGSREVSWPENALARSFFGLLVAILVARARGVGLKVQSTARAWGRSLCGTAAMACTFYTIGAPEIALGDATSLRSTSPVFISLLAPWVLGERGDRTIWVATPLAFAGVVLVSRPSFAIAPHTAALSILAAFLSACAMMFLRRLGPRETPEAVAAHFAAVSTAAMAILAIPVFRWPSLEAGLCLIGTGVSAGLAQVAMTRAYALDHAARVGTISYLGVVMIQVMAAVWLDEIPTAPQLVGSAMVIGAGVLLALKANVRAA